MRISFTALLIFLYLSCIAADAEQNVVISKFNYHGDTLYDSVEIMPKPFVKDLNGYISSSLIYPAEARDKHIQGTVVIGYVIDQRGKIGAAVVVRGSGNQLLDIEGLRVVWNMPRHAPGRHDGNDVPVYMEVPITFALD